MALANMRNLIHDIQDAKSTGARETAIRTLKEQATMAADGLATPIRIAMKPDVLIAIRDGLLTLSQIVENGAKNAGATLPENEIEATERKVKEAIDGSVTNARRFTNEAKEAFAQAIGFSNIVTYSLIIGVILALSLSSLFLMLTITRPIKVMTRIMQKLAQGDTNVDAAFKGRRDEVGQMALLSRSSGSRPSTTAAWNRNPRKTGDTLKQRVWQIRRERRRRPQSACVLPPPAWRLV